MLQEVKISECKTNDVVFVKTKEGLVLELYFWIEHIGLAWTSTDWIVEERIPRNLEAWTKIYKEI